MKTLLALLLGTVALTTAAEANGAAKRKTVVQREVVYVYEPRTVVYEEREPLLALNLLGHGLVISDDLDIDLFDIEERRRLRYREDYYGSRIYGGPRIYVEPRRYRRRH